MYYSLGLFILASLGLTYNTLLYDPPDTFYNKCHSTTCSKTGKEKTEWKSMDLNRTHFGSDFGDQTTRSAQTISPQPTVVHHHYHDYYHDYFWPYYWDPFWPSFGYSSPMCSYGSSSGSSSSSDDDSESVLFVLFVIIFALLSMVLLIPIHGIMYCNHFTTFVVILIAASLLLLIMLSYMNDCPLRDNSRNRSYTRDRYNILVVSATFCLVNLGIQLVYFIHWYYLMNFALICAILATSYNMVTWFCKKEPRPRTIFE